MSGYKIAVMALLSPVDGFLAIKKDRTKFTYITPTLILIWCVFSNIARHFIIHYPVSSVDILDVNFFQEVFSFILPFFLWVYGSYYVTCIFSGETKVREIYAAVCYSFLPYAVLTLPLALLSNVMGTSGLGFYNSLLFLVNLWVVILILVSLSVMNNYSFGRTLGVAFVSIVAVVFIAVIVVLLYVLGAKLFDFLAEVFLEYKILFFR